MNKTFVASLDKLYEMLDFVREQARNVGFTEEGLSQIELATEEALVNIVNYGYAEESGEIEIDCLKPLENIASLKIVIKDHGVPYNPLTKLMRSKITSPSIVHENTPPGGYGVLFILKIMDEVEYRRESETNVLILHKFLC